MGKSSEWVSGANRRYILSAEDVPELERDAGVNEFVQKRPRDEAESEAYSSYRRKHHVQAAAHHLAMMKAAAASGSHKDAKKHSLVYGLHIKELGFDPNDSRVPDEIQSLMSDPKKNPGLRFQAHKGDAFLLNKSDEPTYIVPEWKLSPVEFNLDVLLSPPVLKKSDAPLAKADHPLKVNFLTNKLRQMRDWFDQQGINSINEREVPTELRQQLMRVGRDHQGNFHRDAIQKLINAAPPRDYNFSTGTYTSAVGAAQRHSKDPSNVFRLDMTPEMEGQMRDAGVLDTYKRMQGLSQGAGHPAEDPTLGWVRWTGDKSGVHVDEVQSDFGRPWPAFFADQFNRLAQRGDIQHGEIPRYVDHYSREYPEEQRKIIQKIGFGNKHPAEVLSEAFHEWARTHGELSGAPVHIWQPEAKAYMATTDPFYEGKHKDLAVFDYKRGIPGHLQSAYRDIPVDKQGAVEGQYGEISTQSTAKFKKAPPKSAVGKVGKDIQWRPSTKTYKDTIRGKDRTPKTEKMELSDLPVLAKAAVAEKMLGLVKAAREELVKGDVIPFPADRAKAAVVPVEQRNGKVAGTILPHRLRGQDDASLNSRLDAVPPNEPHTPAPAPMKGMSFLQRLKHKQQAAAPKGHTSAADANPPPTLKAEDKPEEKKDDRRKKDSDDFKGAPKREEDDIWRTTPPKYEPWMASEPSPAKPYMGRKPLDNEKAPGVPGAGNRATVIPDKKKKGNKEAARKWKPSA
jgi:hypothetical protein